MNLSTVNYAIKSLIWEVMIKWPSTISTDQKASSQLQMIQQATESEINILHFGKIDSEARMFYKWTSNISLGDRLHYSVNTLHMTQMEW